MTEFSSQPLPNYMKSDPALVRILAYDRYLATHAHYWDDDIDPFMPHLSLCKFATEFNTAPPIFYTGHKSDQFRTFSKAWEGEHVGPLKTPDPGLERAAARGYAIAAETGSCLELCDAMVNTGSGKQFISYVRHIAFAKTCTGMPMLTFQAHVLNRNPQ